MGIHTTVVEPGAFRTEFRSGRSMRRAGSPLPAYADTVGTFLTAVDAGDGDQPGDPAKAAAAIQRLATEAEPPLRLQFGSDCVSLVEGKLAFVAKELDQWRDWALSTDFVSA